jgi:hypothetical protein
MSQEVPKSIRFDIVGEMRNFLQALQTVLGNTRLQLDITAMF